MTAPTGRPKHVRVNRRTADAVRERIQLSMLVKKLQDHALDGTEMSPTRIDSAKFLINKKMPNPPEERHHTGDLTINWPLPRTKLDD